MSILADSQTKSEVHTEEENMGLYALTGCSQGENPFLFR
jgi:hypothetical protein